MKKTTKDPLTFALDEIAIEVTVHCNLSCTMCSVWQGKKHGIPADLMRSLLDEARDLGAKTFIPCGGEPFMRNDFIDILEHTHKIGFTNSEVVTNGLLLPKYFNRLEKLRSVSLHVSLDGPQGIHDSLRGDGTYGRALSAVREAHRREISVGLSGVLMKPTIESCHHIIDLASEIGLKEVSFQPFQPEIHGMDRDAKEFLFDPDQRDQVNDRISELRELASSRGIRIYTDSILDHVPAYCFEGIRPIPEGGCYLPSRFILVDVSGDLYPCFFMRDEIMGNVLRGDRLKDIWHSETHAALQMLALTSRCPGCLAACSDIATFEETHD